MRTSLRSLLKSPGFTLIAVGALALGIGANAVLFSAINTLFLRPLSFPDPQQLVRVYTVYPDRGMDRTPLSWPRFTAFRDQQDRFSELGAATFTAFTLTGRGEPRQLQSQQATSGFFRVLGVNPLRGRIFTPAEDEAGGADVVLVSRKFWQQEFGGSSDAIGQALNLNGRARTIVGVLPDLPFPFDQTEVWGSRAFEVEGIPADLRDRGTGYLAVVGRLRAGVTVEQAQEQLKTIGARYAAAFPQNVDGKAGLAVVPLQEDLVGQQRPMFFTLLAAVGCVLLVACANVANLFLARLASRRREIAIRTALGATRGRIVAQFLTESVLTAAIAGALGLLLSVWGVGALARWGGDYLPRASEFHLDLRVLAFGVVLSLVTGVVLGLVPALQASRTSASEALKEGGRGTTGGRQAGRIRAALVVVEVAVSLVLLIGAALLINSFVRLQQVETGFRTRDITTFFVGLPAARYPTEDRQARFFQAALEKIGALPGVDHAVATSGMPIVGGGARSPAAAEAGELRPMAERIIARRSTSTPGFFATFGARMVRGRDFTWADGPGARNVVIINELLARHLFGTTDPIGRRIITGIQSVPREVVGVFADLRSQNLAEGPIEEMFYPAMQVDGAFLNIAVHSTRPAASLRPELVAAVHAVDPGIPVQDVKPYAELLAGTIADRRIAMGLLGGFAGLALLLAGMGIYSVIAYGVVQRTNEFGLRLALGASPNAVISMVVKEGVRLALIGLGVGLGVALIAMRLMTKLLFEVSAADPVVYGMVAIFLIGVAAVACLVPARAATKVDPLIALRSE